MESKIKTGKKKKIEVKKGSNNVEGEEMGEENGDKNGRCYFR